MTTESIVVKHPAKFRDEHIEIARKMLTGYRGHIVLDPFAGVGRVHDLRPDFPYTVGVEIEPEWALQREGTIVGDSTDLYNVLVAHSVNPAEVASIFVSPTFGNRMADHHDAKDGSVRNTYRHMLGRPLTDGNSGAMQWGEDYRGLHRAVWREVSELPNATAFVLNIKDHVRAGEVVQVTDWHIATLRGLGWSMVDHEHLLTSGNGFGSNSTKRVPYESMILFRR